MEHGLTELNNEECYKLSLELEAKPTGAVMTVGVGAPASARAKNLLTCHRPVPTPSFLVARTGAQVAGDALLTGDAIAASAAADAPTIPRSRSIESALAADAPAKVRSVGGGGRGSWSTPVRRRVLAGMANRRAWL